MKSLAVQRISHELGGVVELQLLSLSVMVPSKSVKKMILGCVLRVSGTGIANEETGARCRNN